MEEHAVSKNADSGIFFVALSPPVTVFPSKDILSIPMKLFSEYNKKYLDIRLRQIVSYCFIFAVGDVLGDNFDFCDFENVVIGVA
jgi:hypothetical protein